MYAVVRQPRMMSCPAAPDDRDAWARASTMTGTNLAVSGKAARLGHQYLRRVASDGQGGDIAR